MRKYQKKKLVKTIIIIASIFIILAIIGIVLYLNLRDDEEEIAYYDSVLSNNYFTQMTIDLSNKKIKRDNINTNMQKEFNITEEKEQILLSSQEELINFFADTAFEVKIKDNIAYIRNQYQTKKIIIEAESIKDNFDAQKVSKLQDGLYLLEYDTQKRTKAAYEFFKTAQWIKAMENDEVEYIETINDESQTVYGEENREESKYKSYGIDAMGLGNFQDIIRQNGNPSEIVVSTIGYGMRVNDQYFQGRINDKYYNFIEESKEITETIPQGSRVAEVIKEATTDNVKILPLVVINQEGYTTISSIIQAIYYATENSDVICYELTNSDNYMINLALQNSFEKNVPISCVTTLKENNKQIYPANHATTIAVSSIDKKSEITTFSGRGEFIDFAAYSTDVEEIFDQSSTVSKWSGSQYSNAHIVSAIALIKTYHKEYTILETYNVLRNYCKDLGKKGKDELYGYGSPNFSNLKIADIDKQAPEIKEIKYDNEKWETIKKIQIIASDNIRIFAWAITTSKDKPKEWNKLEEIKPTLDITQDIKENGKYYIWVMDSAKNTSYMPIEINKIDTEGPTIAFNIDSSTLDLNKYVTISVIAEDKDSGLNEMPYSWDGQNWGTESNILKVTENGRYKIYAKDTLGNISEKEIKVDVFPREGIANINEGTIIKSIIVSSSWIGDTNDGVRITFNEGLNIVGWKITTSRQTPSSFEEPPTENNIDETENTAFQANEYNNINNDIQENNTDENEINEEQEEQRVQGYNSSLTVTKSLKTNVTYYAWIQNANGDVLYQTFTISKVEI
ncbi:MAG: S8 family serine peptidase [Clostridia bacterium]|nr:S8 family serine peptidase [Clostridia bacterium]